MNAENDEVTASTQRMETKTAQQVTATAQRRRNTSYSRRSFSPGEGGIGLILLRSTMSGA